MAGQLRNANRYDGTPAPGPTLPQAPSGDIPSPDLPPTPQPPIPTIPVPITPPGIPGPFVPAGARTWLQERPWVVPVGSSLAALLLGLTIGVAVGRRRAPRVGF